MGTRGAKQRDPAFRRKLGLSLRPGPPAIASCVAFHLSSHVEFPCLSVASRCRDNVTRTGLAFLCGGGRGRRWCSHLDGLDQSSRGPSCPDCRALRCASHPSSHPLPVSCCRSATARLAPIATPGCRILLNFIVITGRWVENAHGWAAQTGQRRRLGTSVGSVGMDCGPIDSSTGAIDPRVPHPEMRTPSTDAPWRHDELQVSVAGTHACVLFPAVCHSIR